jgi:hypothetical protein
VEPRGRRFFRMVGSCTPYGSALRDTESVGLVSADG